MMIQKYGLFAKMGMVLLLICVLPIHWALASEPTEIRIGAVISLTGANAMTGAEHKWGYEQAVADINAKGGVFVKEYGKKLPIKLILADDKSAPEQAASAMERLIKLDKIDLALSSNVTPFNLAIATVCEKYKVYFQMVYTWLDFVEKENLVWGAAIFADTKSVSRSPFQIWETWPEDQRPKRPALLMEDNMDGQGYGMGFKMWAKEYGYKFAVDEPFSVGTRDFSSYLLKYKMAKVDALITLIPPTDAITLMRQIDEQRLYIPYIQGDKGFWPREFADTLGDVANYCLHGGFWDAGGVPGGPELQKRFTAEFKTDSVNVGMSYANPQILAMAIEKAGSINAKAVRDVVFGGEFKGTMLGDLTFNEKGLAYSPIIYFQWWNGDRKPVFPAKPDVWTIKIKSKP